ncbi:MAG: ribonuclease HII [Patescibacteria group bacterium]|nr:ribonuclease HII [Patescibacteria group bacterium]
MSKTKNPRANADFILINSAIMFFCYHIQVTKFIIGIDEVGRGALAGPVEVAAVYTRKGIRIKEKGLGMLRDSKKLTAKKREQWAEYIKNNPKIIFATARVYPRGVEKMNIARATNEAALRAYEKLVANNELRIANFAVFLDGGLYLGNGCQPKNAKTVVRGDEKFIAVKLASIMAKVSRDRYMTRLDMRYPQYGFAVHKGYGTKAHIAALKKYGVSTTHRLTFLKKYPTMQQVIRKK